MKINPFIRYAQLLKISSPDQFYNLKSFDSRFFYCLDGQGEIEIASIVYKMYKGCVLIWPPNRQYSFFATEKNPMLLIGFNFDFSRTRADLSVPIPPAKSEFFDEFQITEIFNDSTFIDPVYLTHMEEFEQELLKIRVEFAEKKKLYSEIISGMFSSVLYRIGRFCLMATECKKSMRVADELIKFITSNYMNDISNKNLSEHFNYHPNYINKLMKTYTNMSLHQYILSYRLSVALKLIQTTVLPLSEIATLSGFNDFAYFSKYFKKRMAKNPSDFRHSNSELLI